MEEKRLLTHTLKLWREQGNNLWAAEILKSISAANRWLGLHKGGMVSIKEALGIYKQLGHITGQAYSWQELSQLLCHDNQLDAAEEAASNAIKIINLLSNKDDWYLVCRCHRILGNIHFSKDEVEWAIGYLRAALRIAPYFNWHNQLFWGHYSLAWLFSELGKFNDAHTHIRHAKSHVINDSYNLGCAMKLQSRLCYAQCRFNEAKSEALHAADMFEKLGAMKELWFCRVVVLDIEGVINQTTDHHNQVSMVSS